MLNYKASEFQAAVLLAGLEAFEEQVRLRNENAHYLRELLKEIPGIRPQKLPEGTTAASYYLFEMRYDKSHFNDLPKLKFAKATGAGGIPISAVGSGALSTLTYAEQAVNSPIFQSPYSREKRDWFLKTIPCPVAESLIADEAIRMSGIRLLTTKSAMEAIAEAIRKIQTHSKELANA
jgi:dTDP-4-amino-4,6-dideoxygalactose transaminase